MPQTVDPCADLPRPASPRRRGALCDVEIDRLCADVARPVALLALKLAERDEAAAREMERRLQALTACVAGLPYRHTGG